MEATRMTILITSLLLALATAVPALEQADEATGQWLAGDWHVHTSASHDACDPRNATGFVTEMDLEDGCGDGPHTLSAPGRVRMLEAESRGLDYVRLTDHNNLAGPKDARDGYDGPVTLVPGYEHSLSGGHAGISTLDLFDRGLFESPPGTAAGFNDLMDEVHAAPGGLFVVNHPTDGDGEGWMRDGFDWSSVDAFEVWNIHWLFRDDVFLGTVGTSENDEALELWTSLLNDGHELPIVGGSDNHWLATSAIQGIGQPTTWVFAEANTPEAILEAVHDGRTYLSWDFAGPRISLRASSASVTDAMIGDTVPTGEPVTFEVTVTGTAAERVRLVTCDGVQDEQPATPVGFEVTLSFEQACWARVDVLDVDDELGPSKLLYRGLTSPIYVR